MNPDRPLHWCLLALPALAGACSTGKPMGVEEYLSRAWELNGAQQVCSGTNPAWAAAFVERQSSIAAATAAELRKSVASGRATFDGGRARQCIETLARTAASCWGPGVVTSDVLLDVMSPRAVEQLALLPDLTGLARGDRFGGWLAGAPQPCREVVLGRLADGAACFQSYECTSGNCFDPAYHCPPGADCTYVRTSCPGICQPASQEGEPCSILDDSHTCALGLLCGQLVEGGELVCVPPAPAPPPGQPCDGGTCAGAQICIQGPTASTCGVPQDVGGPCTPPAGASGAVRGFGLSTGCYDGLFCSPQTSRCEAAPKAGEPCTCYGRIGSTGICLDRISCDLYTAYCDGSHCLPRVADGQPCQEDEQCQLGSACATSPGICVPGEPPSPFPACLAPAP